MSDAATESFTALGDCGPFEEKTVAKHAKASRSAYSVLQFVRRGLCALRLQIVLPSFVRVGVLRFRSLHEAVFGQFGALF